MALGSVGDFGEDAGFIRSRSANLNFHSDLKSSTFDPNRESVECRYFGQPMVFKVVIYFVGSARVSSPTVREG